MSKHPTYPSTPFYDRLTELSKLKDGWLDGHGKTPTPEALKQAAVLGPALLWDVSLYMYPTEEGGVFLEWSDQHGSHEVEVLPDGHLSLMTVEPGEEATQATKPGNPAADALCAELHRRARHLQTLNPDTRAWDQTYGETLALRGAIGIALGRQVTGSADDAGQAYYRAWLERTEDRS